jgi:hypothetical protein
VFEDFLAAAVYALAPSVKPVVPHQLFFNMQPKIFDFNTSLQGNMELEHR